MLIPSRGPNIATGKCRNCGDKYHRNYQVCTFVDASEENIFCEVFDLTKGYCGIPCLPRDKKAKALALIKEANDRKKAFREKRRADEDCSSFR